MGCKDSYRKYENRSYYRDYFFKVVDEYTGKIIGYSNFPGGICFEKRNQFEKWLAQVKGHTFDDIDEDDVALVFTYRQFHTLISKREWELLNFPVGNKIINGRVPLPVKIEYDDENCCVLFYRYSNTAERV